MSPVKTPTSDLAAHVGEVLMTARGDRSRADVARALGWSRVNLLHVESGEDNPTLRRLARVARALGGHLEVTFVPDE